MSSNNVIGQEGSVDEQTDDQGEVAVEAVRETPELRRSVEQEIQGKVDTNHPDAKPEGLTLEAEERMEARELEIERTRRRFDSRCDSNREARARQTAVRGSSERRQEFQRRASSVDPACDPDVADPRERLTREELRGVNQEAARLAEQLDGWSRAAVSRRLAQRVAHGEDITDPPGRITEILDAHNERTDQVRDLADGPTVPATVMQGLFEDLPVTEQFSGLSEAVGHLDVLEARGEVRQRESGDVIVYEPADSTDGR